MKSNTTFIFAGIMSVIVGNAYATGENTVTSKSYVDAQDALKQDAITAKTTGNVVTYNGTQNGQAQFDERAIFDRNTGWDYENEVISKGHEGDLMTAGDVLPNITDIYSSIDAMHGGPGTVVVRGESGMPTESRNIYDGSTTYNASTDANSIATASFVETKANPMTCAGWPDSVPVADRTDANCWLWNKN